MEKDVKFIGIGFIILLFVYFIIWNFDIPVTKTQVFIIFFAIAILSGTIFIFNIAGDKKRFKQNKSEFINAYKNCQLLWNELTNGSQTLTYMNICSVPKIFTDGGKEKISIQAFIFKVNEISNKTVLLYYWIEKQDLLGIKHNPSADDIYNPFENFNPFPEKPVRVDDRKGVHINFGSKEQKEKFELEKEDY